MTRWPPTHPPTSVAEVVELLGHEFDSEFAREAVTAVVSRLSANDAVSVPVLEHLARNALRASLVAENVPLHRTKGISSTVEDGLPMRPPGMIEAPTAEDSADMTCVRGFIAPNRPSGSWW